MEILVNTQMIINTHVISNVDKKRTHSLFPLFSNTTDYLLILTYSKDF